MNGMLKDKSGNNSSKRIIGFMIILWAMVLVTISLITKVDVPDNTKDVFTALVWIAGAMLTGSVMEHFKK